MLATLHLTLAAGSDTSGHELELEDAVAGAQDGQVGFRLDRAEMGLANWARVAPGVYSILLGGRSYEARVSRGPGAREYTVRLGGEHYRVAVRDPRSRRGSPGAAGCAGPQELAAPMPGKIVKLLVREGEEVSAGQGLLVMEAMKMQNELRAPRSGRVVRIHVAEGAGVDTGAPLVRLV